jgi:sensor histidine kinase YesM
MKNLVFYISCIFLAPIIVIHELLHIIAAEIVLEGYKGISFGREKNIPTVGLAHVDKELISRWKRILMSFAPLISPVIVIILSVFYPFFVYVLIYFVVANIYYKIVSGKFIGLFISHGDIDYARPGLSKKEYNKLVEESLFQ